MRDETFTISARDSSHKYTPQGVNHCVDLLSLELRGWNIFAPFLLEQPGVCSPGPGPAQAVTLGVPGGKRQGWAWASGPWPASLVRVTACEVEEEMRSFPAIN